MDNVLCVLESMWGWRGCATTGERAPQWFAINHQNTSGARLHRILGVDHREGNVWVTNACQTVQRAANDHGTPDPAALATNIIEFPKRIDWLVIGGKIAGDTFYSALSEALISKLCNARILHMPHPAWRMWSKSMEAHVSTFLHDESARESGRAHVAFSENGAASVTFKRSPVAAPFEVWIMKPAKAA